MKPKIPSHISTCCSVTHTSAVHSLGDKESGLHYTNDTLLYTENSGILEDVFADVKIGLIHYGLIMAPEKIQHSTQILFLGKLIKSSAIAPQRGEVRKDTFHPLNGFQTLLGDMNWVRPR